MMPISKYQILKKSLVKITSPFKQLIILSVKGIIYLKEKTGNIMTPGDLKSVYRKSYMKL